MSVKGLVQKPDDMAAKNNIHLHEDIATLKERTNDFCERLDRVETKIDGLIVSFSYWRGRVAAIAAVVGASLAVLAERVMNGLAG